MNYGEYQSTQVAKAAGSKTKIQTDQFGNMKTVPLGSGATADQVQGNVANNAADTGNPVKVGGVYSSPVALDLGDRGDLQVGPYGALKVQLFDGTASALTSANFDSAPAANAYALAVVGAIKPTTAGGLTSARVVSGTSGVIKASAGQLYKLQSVRNVNAAVRYLHLYDKATAPTLSTDTPILTIALAATSVYNSIDIGGEIGTAFASGIAWAYTTDNVAIPVTAGTTAELMFSAGYK